jgi:hypothetical protein
LPRSRSHAGPVREGVVARAAGHHGAARRGRPCAVPTGRLGGALGSWLTPGRMRSLRKARRLAPSLRQAGRGGRCARRARRRRPGRRGRRASRGRGRRVVRPARASRARDGGAVGAAGGAAEGRHVDLGAAAAGGGDHGGALHGVGEDAQVEVLEVADGGDVVAVQYALAEQARGDGEQVQDRAVADERQQHGEGGAVGSREDDAKCGWRPP